MCFNPILYMEDQNSPLITEKGIKGSSNLIIEITPSSNSYIDRYVKKGKYEPFGVQEYWIADPGNKTLGIYKLDKKQEYKLFLFLAEGGEVKSSVLKGISFELREIIA